MGDAVHAAADRVEPVLGEDPGALVEERHRVPIPNLLRDLGMLSEEPVGELNQVSVVEDSECPLVQLVPSNDLSKLGPTLLNIICWRSSWIG